MNQLNYWSLFIEFIDHFKHVSYRGIPLPLLSHFNWYFSSRVKALLDDPVFDQHVQTKISTLKKIQSAFAPFINNLKEGKAQSPKNGYIVLNDELLRIPPQTFKAYFDHKNTILLTRKKKKQKHYPFKQVLLKANHNKLQKHIDHNLNKAKDTFASFKDHPIFSDYTFKRSFYKAIPKMIRKIEAVHQFFDQYPTSCLVVGTTQTLIPRTITLVGHRRGIPSICLQHGNIVGEPSFMPVFATKNAIHGHVEKDWYVQRGVSKSQLAVTGHPRFDEIFSGTFAARKKFRKKVGIKKPRTRTVLVATQPGIDSTFYKEIILKLIEDPTIKVIIKPHPKERRRRNKKGFRKRYRLYKKMNKRYAPVKLVRRELSLYDLLAHVDAVVIWSSTVGLEAMLFDKPVFMFNRALPPEYYRSFAKLKPLIHPTPTSLASAVKNMFHSTKEHKAIQQIVRSHMQQAYPKQKAGQELKQLIVRVIDRH